MHEVIILFLKYLSVFKADSYLCAQFSLLSELRIKADAGD